ncbi:MAG: acetate kinase, partial [Streptococcaceae bacterium]|nr:acetate kinase [Streptococcaceae bacterium]
LNKESGMLGVSELSSDMRDIETAIKEGNEKAILAYSIYADRIRKHIAEYIAVLNGVDAIVFTAGVGENDVNLRAEVINNMSWFGMEINPEVNVFGFAGEISTPESKVKVFVIPTDEELVIARDVEALKN